MQRVETSVLVDATKAEVLAALSPRAIVEHEGTFEVIEVEETEDGPLVRALSPEQDLETALLFTELPNGYGYEQTDAGPFEELYTSISVGIYDGPVEDLQGVDESDDPRAKVTMRSRFTFGGRLARVKDWFAATSREKELQRALFNLADDVVEGKEDESPAVEPASS
ncbi:MAG: SRPBCC family protein [Haloferacaceae archaeon]